MDQQHHVRLDVSLETISIRVIASNGTVVCRGKSATAERTMTWRNSSPRLIERYAVLAAVRALRRARSRQDCFAPPAAVAYGQP